jgi:ribonuclease HI
MKLNFDRASKGNPDPTCFGVVFKDNTGHIFNILVGNLGHDTNNSAELWDLIKGLQAASQFGYQKLIIEGDSRVILALFTKLLNGSEPAKISPNWRLLSLLEYLKSSLLPNSVLIPSHVRWEANKVADKLKNVGIDCLDHDMVCDAFETPSHPCFLE